MTITKSELDAFCENYVDLEAQKKALSDEMKDSVEALASNLEIDKKSVRKFVRDWKEAQKSKEDYVLTDAEADQLILIAFPEFATEAA